MNNYRARRNAPLEPNSSTGKILLTVFAFVGALLLTLAVWLTLAKKQELAVCRTVDATIIDLSSGKNNSCTTVEYEVDGKRYAATLNSYSSTWSVGKTITVAYRPEDPEQITETGFMGYLAPIILGFMGLVFCFVSVSLLVVLVQGGALKKRADHPEPWDERQF